MQLQSHMQALLWHCATSKHAAYYTAFTAFLLHSKVVVY